MVWIFLSCAAGNSLNEGDISAKQQSVWMADEQPYSLQLLEKSKPELFKCHLMIIHREFHLLILVRFVNKSFDLA